MILGAVLFLSWTAISLPATMQLVGDGDAQEQADDGRLDALADPARADVARAADRRALIVAWGETDGVRLAFAAALVMAVIATLAAATCSIEDGPPSESRAAPKETRCGSGGR